MPRRKARKKEGDADDMDAENDNNDQDEKEKPSAKEESKATRTKRKSRSSRSASKKAMGNLKEHSTEDEGEQSKKDSGDDDDSPNENESIAADSGAAAKDDENDATEDEDYGGSEKDDDEEEAKKQPKKKQKTSKGKEHKCPHCEKKFTSQLGLKYHVDNFVCRIHECKDPAILEKANKKKRPRGKSKHKSTDTPKTYKRFRGKLENRVCPHCDRVFTSTLGLKYHVSRRVCQQNTNPDSSKMLFHNLEPGERFVTKFGVVQVVSDDRSESTAHASKIPQDQLRNWNSTKSKIEKQRSKVLISKYTRLRARKHKINELLGSGNSVNKASVFYAYHGCDPTEFDEFKELLPLPSKPVDPQAPEESCPDRIVECMWLQPDGSAPANSSSSQRLFLQRRILTEPYMDSKDTHVCPDCGSKFTSAPGYRYHSQNRVCVSKKDKLTSARKDREMMVEVGAARILKKKYCPPEYQVEETLMDKPQGPKKKKRKARKKKDFGMYPEVLISLGYKVVKEDIKITDEMLFQSAELSMLGNSERQATLSLTSDAPDKIMVDLKQKLLARQRVSDDQKYGCMYKEVYKALGFAKPRKRKEIGSSLRRKRAKVVKPPPPIIDVSALADEIDSGRYPSKKRYKGDDHLDYCAICKDGGTLLCCDFCKNAVHMHCMAERFTIKAPEPDDDFMCHRCIGIIMSRRKRAEGRRLKKREKDELDNAAIQKQNPDIKTGMEYDQLASKGREYSELIELLQDARQRLRQSLATSKMNDIRRKLMQFD